MRYSFHIPIYQTINFWICVGLFVYITGSFFYVLLINSSKNVDVQSKNQLILIYGFVTILKNVILAFALTKNHNSQVHDDSSMYIPNELNLDSFNANNLNKD
jgi:hypothetical protein